MLARGQPALTHPGEILSVIAMITAPGIIEMRLPVTRWLCVPLVLALAACTHMPADVASELSAPDGLRPNNFADTSTQAESE